MYQPKNKRIKLSPSKKRDLEEYIYSRDGSGCQQCGVYVPYGTPGHHVIPKSRGGNDSRDNLVLLCQTCHSAVHDKGMKLRQEIYEMLAEE